MLKPATTLSQSYNGYETGPIRPPSEAASLLIRVTRNCSWNRCTFCPGYDKSEPFSIRPTEHVLNDIDTIKKYVSLISASLASSPRSGFKTAFPRGIQEVMSSVPSHEMTVFHMALNWYRTGMTSVFLQDGNSLMIKPEKMIVILKHIRNSFPEVESITTFVRAATVCRIDDEDLMSMADKGLTHVQIGFESGSDTILRLVDKGSSSTINREAGLKIKTAGIGLSVYLLWGLGGLILSREHALESAWLINEVNPDVIRFVTLSFPDDKALYVADQHLYERAGEVDVINEIRCFIKALNTSVTSFIESDFQSNLIHEITGLLPRDKEDILAEIDRFLTLSTEKQKLYVVGKRTMMLSDLDDLGNPAKYHLVESRCRQNGVSPEKFETLAQEIVNSYLW